MEENRKEYTAEELELKRQQIEEGLKELKEISRIKAIEYKEDLKLKIFHPFKWREKHKDDPIWERYTNIVSFKFVNFW